MDRRGFLRGLLGATALTAAGLVVPSRTTYVFLTENPLADTHVRHLMVHRSAFGRALAYELDNLKEAFIEHFNDHKSLWVNYHPDPDAGGTVFFS